jgi:hypothetical protein
MIRKAMLFTAAAAVALTTACDSPTAGNRDARVTVLLTDAPHEYLASAVVTIGRIELLPAGGPPVVITTDGGTFDLLTLQDGVTAALGSADIEPGRYLQMRMIVSSAELTLKDGYTFNDGSAVKDVPVPSGAQTGIKINLTTADGEPRAGVEIKPGETVLVVDFDVSQNFVMQGSADTPAGIQGFLFTPLLRAVVEDVAGSIAGTVTAPDGVATKDLTVTATRQNAPDGETPASTLVKDDGTFKVHFLAPGTYDVTVAAPPEHSANTVKDIVVASKQHVTGVELIITKD